MLEDDHEQFRFDARRRLLLFGGINAGLFMLLTGRLFHLQVLKGGLYHDLAENNRISLQPIPAPRGRIFDRDGRILVENSPDYQLAVIPDLTGGLRQTLVRLQPVIGLTASELETVLKQAKRQRSFLPVRVKAHLSWENLSRIEARIANYPGVIIQTQSLRHYPFGRMAAHVLGYLGEALDADRKAFSALRFRSGDLVGKTGMERLYEPYLRGNEGVRELEVNAYGRQVRELHTTQPRPGNDLTLTIDGSLQREAEKALEGMAGSVVAMDPRSGEILAMASQPAYDPNQFIRGFSSKQWQELVSDHRRPLTNKSIQGNYPPGSTFKMIVALAALEAGIIDPEEPLYCNGHLKRQNHQFNCWNRSGHGWVTMERSLAESCDVYYYRLAEKLGIDAIARQAWKFGLGDRTGIGLASERSGLIPSKAWKQAVHKTIWFPGETLISAIGQGYVLSTPLQLAAMTAALANGGILYRPTLVRPPGVYQPVVTRNIGINPEHLAVIRRGMQKVYTGRSGTARNAQPVSVRAAGKTGTSQVIRHRRGHSRRNETREEKFRDHALFVGYAPIDNPEIAISVVIEHGGSGGATAAPVCQRILDHHFSTRNNSVHAPDTGKT
ncbi:MAG: penicillin-binding protein 2 [Magnetococcales bacterium]|nr:penicillin-binding protein 2 [Magnetococcales bacterium]